MKDSGFKVLPVFKEDLFKGVVLQSRLMAFFSDYNQKLEKTVKDKTQELIAINEQLKNEIQDREIAEKERNELTKQIYQTEKIAAIGNLAGGIAHDFNNILSGILGFAQLAGRDINSPEKALKHIDRILIGVKRAADLVGQILTFSRQSDSKKYPLDAYIVLKESIQLIRAIIPSTITIEEKILSKAKILADPTQFHQVIMNLCTNAYHAMGNEGGVLGIGLYDLEIGQTDNFLRSNRMPGEYLVLEVTDTGHGIERKNLNKIFDPFFTTKEVGKGTGLGLSVVEGIMNDHKGFIEVRSNEGQGTLFKVFFPVIKHDASPCLRPEGRADELRGTEKVMIVDDEPAILEILKNILSYYGYQVSVFHDGKSALESFSKSPDYFDVVITDMTMPGMTGKVLSEEILKLKAGISIIICTGYHENFSEQDALKVGIQKFMLKPVTGSKLHQTIRELFKVQNIL
ncbi:hybrid sensor histidine kinase/response regulator [Desulfobacter curvatus]|uniref:hybrid sensor histidine kinase/response regulator n=1 Tax=Desulfobacter curvatus TaxID=2290 RepID=UPI00146E58D7|nr:response regulator [Desulfobacter curvatus]